MVDVTEQIINVKKKWASQKADPHCIFNSSSFEYGCDVNLDTGCNRGGMLNGVFDRPKWSALAIVHGRVEPLPVLLNRHKFVAVFFCAPSRVRALPVECQPHLCILPLSCSLDVTEQIINVKTKKKIGRPEGPTPCLTSFAQCKRKTHLSL
jgi:hypothetical protein